jgi:Fe-S cluster assembly iron-binding protein IscA
MIKSQNNCFEIDGTKLSYEYPNDFAMDYEKKKHKQLFTFKNFDPIVCFQCIIG